MIKNLNQLRRTLREGTQLEILDHCRPECIGQIRNITLVNTQGFYSTVLAVVREIGNGLDQQLVLAGNHPLIIDSGCLSDHHARIFRTEIPFDGFDVALPLAADDCGHRLRRSNAGIGNAGLEG